ncbi:MAG: hypothetical protein SGJ18_07145 [Pseudomonadota bacterium]|nr:hypothetical protein [Pseudomonadota bacterium]
MKSINVFLLLISMYVPASASEVYILENLNVTEVVQYQNLMPGPARLDIDVTLITANYSRCGSLSQESVQIKVDKVSGEYGTQYRVAILAPGTDCSGLPTLQTLQLSVKNIPYHSRISFENPVMVIDQGAVH